MSDLTQTVRWIPVGERLPDTQGKKMIAYEDGYTDAAYWCPSERKFYIMGTEMILEHITHWSEPLKSPAELAQ